MESIATNLVIGDVPKNNYKKEENEKKNEYKNKKFEGMCYHCGQKGRMSKDCRVRRNGSYKKFEKAEKAINGDGDELVLCSLTRDSKKKSEKKKVRFANNVKQPSEAGKMCTIDGNTFHLFMKNTWIGDSGASCHITNNISGMSDVMDINKSIQGSSRVMPATRKGKLHVTVCQVNRQEQVHTLWPVKFCPSTGANLFLLTCELLQGNMISSNNANNIVMITPIGNIFLDRRISDSWVAGVNFYRNAINKKDVFVTAFVKRDINNLHVELSHPSEAIMRSTAKNFGIQVTGTFRPCEDCALGKAEQ